MRIGRRWKERGETLMPASLSALAVVLDMLLSNTLRNARALIGQ